MRRITAVILGFALIIGALPGRTTAETIGLFINGQFINPQEDQGAPFILHGRVMVPLRVVAELLHADVEWIPNPRSVRIQKGSRNVMVIIDKTYGIIDGVQFELEVPASIYNGKTYVPLRFVGEALGLKVEWDPVQRAVLIDEGAAETAREGLTAQLSLEGLPVQGAEVTVRAALTDTAPGGLSGAATGATLEVRYREDGARVTRSMTRTDIPGVFVTHLGLFTKPGYTFDLKVTLTAGGKATSAELAVTVLESEDEITAAQLDSWQQGGFRPQFISPLTDLATELMLPASIRVEGAPSDIEEGDMLQIRVLVEDAYLKPITGLRGDEVTLVQQTMDGERQEASAAEVEPGVYLISTPALYAGYGGTVTWEASVRTGSKVLGRLRGSFMTR